MTLDPARVLRPGRPRLAAALAAAGLVPDDEQAPFAGCDFFGPRGYFWRGGEGGERKRWVPFEGRDPVAVWEALAAGGVIPRAWLDDDGRRYAYSPLDHEANPEEYPRIARSWGGAEEGFPGDPRPVSVASMVTVAADPDGLAAAEAHARAACEAIGLRPKRVVWTCDLRERVAGALRYRADDVANALRQYRGAGETLARALAHAAAWPWGHPRRRDVDPASFVASREAWERGLALLATGYAPYALDDVAIRLACPLVERHREAADARW